MKKGAGQGRGGFTIVETSLVIAIAGLIFLMIFVALPALMRLQRDTQRRENISTLLSKVKKYQTNNRGGLPGTSRINVAWSDEWTATEPQAGWDGFYYAYLGNNFIDPNGGRYQLYVTGCEVTDSGELSASKADQECNTTKDINVAGKSFPNGYTIYMVIGATCSGEKVIGNKNPRKVAALYKLEGGGAACLNT